MLSQSDYIEKINNFDFYEGEILLFNKPLEWTSFDVVNKLRQAVKALYGKKVKVGHAGTLDPLATGLLILATGRKTKLIDTFQGLDKTYSGQLKLGATTPCLDSEMEEDQVFDTSGITESAIREAAASLTGIYQQEVPIFSAVKVDGRRLFKKARRGEEVEIKKREVEVYSFDIKSVEMPFVDFEVKCRKGTYVRALANDLGKKLNNGAYLTGLQRLKIGDYSVEDAIDVIDLADAMYHLKRQNASI